MPQPACYHLEGADTLFFPLPPDPFRGIAGWKEQPTGALVTTGEARS